MGSTSKDATQNRLGDHKPKNPFETSLWQAWIWYELLGSSEDSTFWVQNVYGEKSFESNPDWQLIRRPWRCSSWIVTRNSIIPYRLSDVFMSFNVFARRHSRNGFLKQNMSKKSPCGSASHLTNMGSWKAGSPASNPQGLKVAKSWISTSFHWLAGVATQDNRDHNQYPVVHILDTTTLSFASIMQRYWAGGACCRSQGP